MRCITITATLILLTSIPATAQAVVDCPTGLVCISREAALKALENADRVKALELELKTLKEQAIPDLKQLLADMRVEFARCSGEATILKQRAVSDAALMDVLVKNSRKKSIGLINLF